MDIKPYVHWRVLLRVRVSWVIGCRYPVIDVCLQPPQAPKDWWIIYPSASSPLRLFSDLLWVQTNWSLMDLHFSFAAAKFTFSSCLISSESSAILISILLHCVSCLNYWLHCSALPLWFLAVLQCLIPICKLAETVQKYTKWMQSQTEGLSTVLGSH